MEGIELKLKYFIEFTEVIEDVSQIEPNELAEIARSIKNHLHTYLTIGDFKIDGDIKLEFDLEEDEE